MWGKETKEEQKRQKFEIYKSLSQTSQLDKEINIEIRENVETNCPPKITNEILNGTDNTIKNYY